MYLYSTEVLLLLTIRMNQLLSFCIIEKLFNWGKTRSTCVEMFFYFKTLYKLVKEHSYITCVSDEYVRNQYNFCLVPFNSLIYENLLHYLREFYVQHNHR